MIIMYLHTRPNRMWVATGVAQGTTMRAIASEGASNKLAAIMRRRGVRDQPVRIFNPKPGKDYSEHASLYAWADFDYGKEMAKWLGQPQD